MCVYLSHTIHVGGGLPGVDLGRPIADKVQSFSDWISTTFDTQTGWIKDRVTYGFLNPLQDLIARVTVVRHRRVAILALACVLGGRWAAVRPVICLAGIYVLDLWYNAMVTLTMTLVATSVRDDPGGHLRRLDGPKSNGRHGHPARSSTLGRHCRRSCT